MNDDWIETTLGQVFEICNAKLGNHEVEPRVLSLSKYDGFVPSDEYFDKRIASANLDGYKIVHSGEWAYSTIHIDEGSIARNTLGHVGVISPMYTTMRWISTCHDPGYFELMLRSPDMVNRYQNAAQGTVNRRRSLPFSTFVGMSVRVPPLPVQRRIVDLMAHLDNQIARLRLEQDAVAHVVTAARLTLTAQWPMVPLESLCDVVAPLVDPRSDEFADLLHIGIERMEKGGGQLLPLESARIEGLISSKYLFGERDVVFSKIRPNLKKVVVPGFVGLCSADAYPLTPVEGVPGALLREVLLLPTVTEQIVGKSSRTKMPKVNRRELMTVTVPMSSSHRERDEAVAVLNGLRLTSMALESESSRLRDSRTALLGALLSQEVELPSSYDSLLSGVS